MPGKKLTPEKQKEWDEVMKQIRAELDILPAYNGGYFNNAAAMERHNKIFEKYKDRLREICGEDVYVEDDISPIVKSRKFSDLIVMNPKGFPELPKRK